MAGLSKDIVTGIGAVLTTGILGAGIFYGVLPQMDRAADYQDQVSNTEQNIELNSLRLTQLASHAENPDELNQEKEALREGIPEEASVPDIQRAIVNNLGGFDLVSFSHAPAMSFDQPEVPELTLEGIPDPFDESTVAESDGGSSNDDSGEMDMDEDFEDIDPDTVEEDLGIDTSDSESSSSESVGTVQAVPIVLNVETTASSHQAATAELAALLDRLESDDRMMLVLKVSSGVSDPGEGGQYGINANIHLYAFTTS